MLSKRKKTPEIFIMRATMVSLLCNVVLVSIKSVALVLVNSLAIAVDLGISFVGLCVSVILYYSMKLANKPADIIHNYGYGKVENVCETLEGVVLIGIALAMSSQAAVDLFHPSGVSLPLVGLGTSCVNATINFVGARYIFKMARKSESPAIHAEGVHYRLEGVVSGIIAVSFPVEMLLRTEGLEAWSAYVDPLAALFVSALIIIPSFKLAKSSFFKLLDASVEEDSQMEILKKLSPYIGRFCEFKDMRTRTSGRKKFVEFKLVVPEEISFKKGHQLCYSIERDIRSGIRNCEVLIRMEPCDKDCEFVKNGQECPYL